MILDKSIRCFKCGGKKVTEVYHNGNFKCSVCGVVELPSHMICARCDFSCMHVECAGIYYCPNCGKPEIVSDGMVKYYFNSGCNSCGLSGHLPKDDLKPVTKYSVRYAFGLSPCYDEEDVTKIMEE